MTQNIHCSLIIDINKNNQLHWILIDPMEKKVKEETISLAISFDMNEIIINSKIDNSICFIENWISQPDQFKEYQIQYQNKEYFVIAEVLFALIIFKIKMSIEKQYIIDKTELQISSSLFESLSSFHLSQFFINRIKVSLESIGLKGIDFEDIDYDYSLQGDILEEIITKYEEFLKYKSLLERANLSHLIDNKRPLNEEEFTTVTRQFSFKERSEMKLCQLDNYCIFISSRFLESVNDHINLVKTCKRLRLNMTKFHYNPIPLTSKTRQYFPNIETLIQYQSKDKKFSDDKKIKFREGAIAKYNLCFDELDSIEEWTNLTCGQILFDSNKDDWTDYDVLLRKIENKEKVLFLIEDTFGEKFGMYIHGKLLKNHTRESKMYYEKTFMFHLNSNKSICKPMKFHYHDMYNNLYSFGESKDDYLFHLGEIILMKKNSKNQSYWKVNHNQIKYNGIEMAISGKRTNKENKIYFTPKQFKVIQMKRPFFFRNRENEDFEMYDELKELFRKMKFNDN